MPLTTPAIPTAVTNVRRIKVYRRSRNYPRSTQSSPTRVPVHHQSQDSDDTQYPDPYWWYHRPTSKRFYRRPSSTTDPFTILKL